MDDSELVKKYKTSKDNKFVGELYKRYTQFVFLVSMKYLKDEEKARDAVMQIFEKLMEDLLKHDVEKFKPWLHIVTKNHCLLQIRSKTYELKKQVELQKDTIAVMESSESLYLEEKNRKEETLQKLESAIKELKKEQQECIKLFYIEEKSYKEVADISGYSMNQVKSYIQNGKRNLHILMTQTNER